MERIYLDHNATTPVDPLVVDAMLPYLTTEFGNPSAITHEGRRARLALDRARRQVADFIGGDPAEVVFTSGGTEADNQALLGAVAATGRNRVITSAIEHQAILTPCEQLERDGLTVTRLGVDGHGQVDPDEAIAALGDDVALVSVMLANNDVGTLQPVEAIAAAALDRGVLSHTDAIQAVGKLPVDVNELGVDLLSLSGHKFHGPKGVGALWIRGGTPITPLLRGGSHESRRRAGTENVAGIVGLGRACELARERLDEDVARIRGLRDRLESAIRARVEGGEFNGHPDQRLPNVVNVSFPGVDAELALMNLDVLGVTVSSGSACSSGSPEPSHVLLAMGRDRERAEGAIRMSLGRDNSEDEIDRTVDALHEVLERLREMG